MYLSMFTAPARMQINELINTYYGIFMLSIN